jgi:hypothetical protein
MLQSNQPFHSGIAAARIPTLKGFIDTADSLIRGSVPVSFREHVGMTSSRNFALSEES